MRIVLLTKEALEHTPFFAARRRLIEFLSIDNDVSLINIHALTAELSAFDLGIGFFYPHILKREEFEAPRYGTVNIHPAYLPYNRGAAPNVFAIVNHHPAGVTIHKMSERVDEGDILFQDYVPVHPVDTGETLYYRLLDASVETFIHWWDMGHGGVEKYGGFDGVEQDAPYIRTNHVKDLEKLDDLEEYFGKATAHQFVDILRARTFTGHESSFIRAPDGRKVYVRVQLAYE